MRTVLQVVGVYIVVQYAMKQFMPATAPQVPAMNQPFVPGANRHANANYNHIPQTIVPVWPTGINLELAMYISPSMAMPALKTMPKESLVFHEKSFMYGSKQTRDFSKTFKVPHSVQNNASLWAHIYIAHDGAALDPTDHSYDVSRAYRVSRPLTQYLPRKKETKSRNLLSSSDHTEVSSSGPADDGPRIASFYHPNITLAFVTGTDAQPFPQMQPALRQYVQLDPTGARDESGQNGWYYPILFTNTFWQLRAHMIELNDTVTELPLNVHIKNEAHWIFSILASMDEGVKETARRAANGNPVAGGGDGSELEMIKEVLLDSNVYLLAVTGVVSVLHMIFEMLAFKADVSHWRKKKDNVGTSLRTIFANIVMQSIILLYLMDNNENTSWMILFGQAMGIAIEAWKITKVVNVRVRPAAAGSIIPYRIALEDQHQLSDLEKKSQEYDEIAFNYLYMAAVPLLLAYAGYSLVYDTHKSWYSYIIAALVGSVYAYGFLMMLPALYVNHRLKSVAHIPARAMTYKCLNTFIDDLFAFTIKMPTLHRLATLRDDLVFFIYLYQAWAYKVSAHWLASVDIYAKSLHRSITRESTNSDKVGMMSRWKTSLQRHH